MAWTRHLKTSPFLTSMSRCNQVLSRLKQTCLQILFHPCLAKERVLHNNSTGRNTKVHEMQQIRSTQIQQRVTCTVDLHSHTRHKHTHTKRIRSIRREFACLSHWGGGGLSGFSAECVRVQCHVSFQTVAGETPNASVEISTVRAKTQGEEQHVLAATHPHGG